jgi:ATP-dependent RNA helicase DeaD
MTTFDQFGLSEDLNKSLRKMDYTKPTPIQLQAIPLGIQGKDVLGSAQTGTGKTAAFSIPMVERILNNPTDCGLILTPTRELAKQVLEVVHQLIGFQSPIKTAFIIGGEPMHKQLNQLKQRPRIIVGTPGRINDHLERGTLMLNNTNMLVLDETDRMLDMGFGVQLDKIIKFLPKKRQTLMFSATLPDGIVKLSNKYLTNPERIAVGETNVLAKNIKQEVIHIEQPDKYAELVNQLHERTGTIIIFAKTKHGCDKMAKKLRNDGFDAEALHGDLRQNKRTSIMNKFRNKTFRILVATDIAARGLDVPHIEHVINHDLPQVAEDYIHRMGRTARAGATGSAISFVSKAEGRIWHAIECLLNPNMKKQRPPAEGPKKKPRRSSGKPNGKFGERSAAPKKGNFKSGKPRRDSANDERPAKKNFKPRNDRPTGDKPRSDKPRSDRPRADKPRGDRPNKNHGSNPPQKRTNNGGNSPARKRVA